MLQTCRIYDKEIYRLIDDRFTKDIKTNVPSTYEIIIPEVIIINEYKSRSENIPHNLALFYLNLYHSQWHDPNSLQRMNLFAKKVDEYLPQLNYSKTIYLCVLNKLKQLSFGGSYAKKNI